MCTLTARRWEAPSPPFSTERGDFLRRQQRGCFFAKRTECRDGAPADGVEVTFKQIAGLIARRIVFNRQQGETLRMGERIGMMKFGSRMDVLLGPEWNVS